MIEIIISILLFICLYRYLRWVVCRLHMYTCLRRTAKKISAHFTTRNPMWLFAKNGDGKISFMIEDDDTVYYIHLCGSVRLRCSYIFSSETKWIRRQYGLLGRGQSYSDKIIPVKRVVLPEDVVTIKKEHVIYLFAPVPIGCGIALQGREGILPCGPKQDMPGGILHNTKSFCAQLCDKCNKEVC